MVSCGSRVIAYCGEIAERGKTLHSRLMLHSGQFQVHHLAAWLEWPWEGWMTLSLLPQLWFGALVLPAAKRGPPWGDSRNTAWHIPSTKTRCSSFEEVLVQREKIQGHLSTIKTLFKYPSILYCYFIKRDVKPWRENEKEVWEQLK